MSNLDSAKLFAFRHLAQSHTAVTAKIGSGGGKGVSKTGGLVDPGKSVPLKMPCLTAKIGTSKGN